MDGCPLGLGLVVEDKPTEFSCICALCGRRYYYYTVLVLVRSLHVAVSLAVLFT